MLISKNKSAQFIKTPFENEAELEQVVIDNYEYLFGPNSFYLAKSKIKTAEGSATIPDGFAIDIEKKNWYLVEAELIHHNLWNHIAPQIIKQLLASKQLNTRKKIIDLAVEQYKINTATKEKFDDFNINEIDVHRFIENILEKDPIVGLPIDALTQDIKDWAITLKYTVKLWEIHKFVEFKNPDNIIYEFPEEFMPALDTEVQDEVNTIEKGIQRFEVTISDLIAKNLLSVGQKLTMTYKPRNKSPKTYQAEIQPDGSLSILGHIFGSPTYAALFGIRAAGSERPTVNGWTSWRTLTTNKTLAAIREEYLNNNSTSQFD